MSNLREAAQQALEALEWHLDWGTWGADLDGCAAALRAALEQQAEPEPVAWMVVVDGGTSAYVTDNPTDFVMDNPDYPESAYRALPLYTAPPQRKPLTDEEIVEAVREVDLDWQAGWTLDEHEPNRFTTLARAIERAHGIGEEK